MTGEQNRRQLIQNVIRVGGHSPQSLKRDLQVGYQAWHDKANPTAVGVADRRVCAPFHPGAVCKTQTFVMTAIGMMTASAVR